MSSPGEEAAAGAARAAIEWSEEKVKQLVWAFKNRKIRFIEDKETIELVRNQRRSEEWKFYDEYIADPTLRILVQMGMTLRKLEESDEHEPLQGLRDKILRKYGTDGLHVAEFVQNEALAQAVMILVTKMQQKPDVQKTIETLLSEIDKYFLFVKSGHDPLKQANMLIYRISANVPPLFVLVSKGSANDTLLHILNKLAKEIEGYEPVGIEDGPKRIVLLVKKELA